MVSGLMMRMLLLAGLAALSCLSCSPKETFPPGDTNPRPFANQRYVGLTKQQAVLKAWGEGRTWRVVQEDGEHFPVTKDKRPDRLNFTLRDGVVVKVTKG